ncbi:MAG: metallophosphoesterase [Roseobacter sp.]
MHRDLGTIDGSIVLFGGPYSNLQATRALLNEAFTLGCSGHRLICTGDVVAYAADPVGTVDAIMSSGAIVVAGNCEKQLSVGANDCGCGFEEGTTCDLLSAGWYAFAARHLTEQGRGWMMACPDIVSFRHQGARYAVIHGGFSAIARFIWPTSDLSIFTQEWALIEQAIGSVDHVVAGHCGIPFERVTPKGRWINAGVIGMPPHDGGQQTRYAILDGGEVRFHRLTYDVEAAFDAMVQADLTQGYHESLRSGYWPSEDILPEPLRAPSLAKG